MKKIEYILGQLNCAETVIDAYNKNFNKNIPVSLGSGMGSGATIGSICGAINAAILIIGAEFGRSIASDPNEAKNLVKKLLKSIKEKYGSEICINLKKSGVSCQEIVEFTYDELEKIMVNS